MATRLMGGTFLNGVTERQALVRFFGRRGRRCLRGIGVGATSGACSHCRLAGGQLVRFVGFGCSISSVLVGSVGIMFVRSFLLCVGGGCKYDRGATVGFMRHFHAMMGFTGGANLIATSPFKDCQMEFRHASESCLAVRRVAAVCGRRFDSGQLRRMHSLFVFDYCATLSCVSMYRLERRSVHAKFSNGL